MNKIRFLLACAVLVCNWGQLEAQNKKNVLFIMVDDLRNDLGCYGNKTIKTPNIDKLAGDALVFNRAYCQQSVCSPSRTSMLTGLRPDSTRVYNLVTHFRDVIPDVVTLPQYFLQNGYYTKGIGKIYHKGLDDPYSWSDTEKPKSGDSLSIKRRNNAYRPKSRPDSAYAGPDVPDNYYDDGKYCDEALASIKALSKKTQPFFLAVGFKKPHLPFHAPKKYWDMYAKKDINTAENDFLPECMPHVAYDGPGELRLYQGVPDSGRITGEDARVLRHAYYACISYIDAQIGKLIAELKKNGVYDNTIIVVVGDHGWKLGEHDMWGKHTNFELDTRVPLIVRVPGKPVKGKKTESLTELVDLYPSLCGLAGLPEPRQKLHGMSFAALFTDEKLNLKEAAYSQYPRPDNVMGYTMRTDRYRLTQWFHRRSEIVATELYDHENDAAENKNLACDEKYKTLIAELTAKMLREVPALKNVKK